MNWQNVRGHGRQLQWFQQQYASGRLGSSFLFVGPTGIGKRTFAMKLAQALLCNESTVDSLMPCEECSACRQVKGLTHPDLLTVSRKHNKSQLQIEQFVGDREHRMREGLCYDISLKPYCGGKRIAVIDDADYLSVPAANALLKTLEEPPPQSVIILIGTNKHKQLPTIRSRCQVIRFSPLSHTDLSNLVLELDIAEDEQRARQLATIANGSIERARSLVVTGVIEFREEFCFKLANPATVLTDLVELVSQFVDLAVDELPADQKAKARRSRLQQVIEMATEFFRRLMRQLAEAEIADDALLAKTVTLAAQQWPGNIETALACIDCCLEADVHVQQNANQKTLLEAWLDRLQTLIRTQDSITLPVP